MTPELHPFLKRQANILAGTEIRETVSSGLRVSGKDLIEQMSFSYLAELVALEDLQKHYFYEIECIRGNWSVRELKHQIASLYYERCGLSKDPPKTV